MKLTTLLLLLATSISSWAGIPPNKVTGQTYIQKNGVNSVNASAIDLTANVTGVLPSANGGTGSGAFTLGSIPFSNGTSLTQDNSKLFWNDTNFQLGIGTNTPTASLNIVGSSSTAVSEIITEASSQTADVMDGFDSLGNILFAIKSDGSFGIHKLSPAAMLEIDTKSTTQPQLLLKALASQTIGMLQLKDPSNNVLDNFLPSGNVGLVGAASAASTLTLALPTALPASSQGINFTQSSVVVPVATTLENFNFSTDTTAYPSIATLYGVNSLIIQQKAGTAGDSVSTIGENVEAINSATNSAGAQFYNTSGGVFESAALGNLSGTATGGTFNNVGLGGRVVDAFSSSSSGTNALTDIGIYSNLSASSAAASAGTVNYTGYGFQSIVAGAPNTAHLLSTDYGFWASVAGAGTNWDFYGSTGKSYFKGPIGLNQVSPVATLDVITEAAATKGITIKETASQSADMFDVLNSSGTTIDGIAASGNVGIITPSISTSSLSIGMPTALPVSSSFISTPNSNIVFPSSIQGVTINLNSDATAYAAGGLAYGVSVNVDDAKAVTGANSIANIVGYNATVGGAATVSTSSPSTYNLSGISENSVNPSYTFTSTSTGNAINSYGANLLINDSNSNTSSGTNAINDYGVNVQISNFGSSSAGTLTKNSYGGKFSISGITGANFASTGYGVWASSSGNGTNWDFYAASGNPSFFTGTVSVKHLIGNGGAPSIAAGAGAGTGPTVFVSGTDTAGAVIIITGTLPTVSSVAATVTFLSAFASNPFMSLTPGNAATALLSGATGVFVTPSTTNFTITAGPSGLVAATTYLWYYHVVQ